MQKILFFDYRELEQVQGYTRRLEQPVKVAGPLLVADQPWENGNMQLYGSVAKSAAGPFQLWYSTIHDPWRMHLGYAESDDGLRWRKPLFDTVPYAGGRTNLVLDRDPHGVAVIRDERDPDPTRRYKMLAGATPDGAITAFASPDGIAWRQLGTFPVITTGPDCPMGLFRAVDGRYVAFHRVHGYGRRVFRSESWDFRHWSGEPRMVLEPGPLDGCQVQFYGFGATTYGSYEIGTLWIFHTDSDELGFGKMNGWQDAELTVARSGYAVHRVAAGTPFIPHGAAEAWDCGNLQCASQPLLLDDEMRWYYAGTTMRHMRHWELQPQNAGLGMARLKPDRFVALEAGASGADLLTVEFHLRSPHLFINAATARDGWVKAEILDAQAQPLAGFGLDDGKPFAGDAVMHPLVWRGSAAVDPAALMAKPVRIRIAARHARLYAIANTDPGETPVYHRFQAVSP